jgi:hypothetical protein
MHIFSHFSSVFAHFSPFLGQKRRFHSFFDQKSKNLDLTVLSGILQSE